MHKLTRADVVGRRIEGIYQTPFLVDPDGHGGCRVFVKLDTNVSFELECADLRERLFLMEIDLSDTTAFRISSDSINKCIGDTIDDVVQSEYWPSIGLSTSNGFFVYLAPMPNPDFSGGFLTGPCVEPINSSYGPKDTSSCIWE
jgi:hypothetical protein